MNRSTAAVLIGLLVIAGGSYALFSGGTPPVEAAPALLTCEVRVEQGCLGLTQDAGISKRYVSVAIPVNVADGGNIYLPAGLPLNNGVDCFNELSCSLKDCGAYPGVCDGGSPFSFIAPTCLRPRPRQLADGGLDFTTPVDCLRVGPLSDGGTGATWRGFTIGPASVFVGTECERSQCSIFSGDGDPYQEL